MAKAYRYIDKFQWLDEDEWEERIDLVEFDIIRETEKGFFIRHYGKEKFVLNGDGSGKRFAYRKKEHALNHFMIRKSREVGHLKRRLAQIQRILEYNKDGKNTPSIHRCKGAVVHRERLYEYHDY